MAGRSSLARRLPFEEVEVSEKAEEAGAGAEEAGAGDEEVGAGEVERENWFVDGRDGRCLGMIYDPYAFDFDMVPSRGITDLSLYGDLRSIKYTQLPKDITRLNLLGRLDTPLRTDFLELPHWITELYINITDQDEIIQLPVSLQLVALGHLVRRPQFTLDAWPPELLGIDFGRHVVDVDCSDFPSSLTGIIIRTKDTSLKLRNAENLIEKRITVFAHRSILDANLQSFPDELKVDIEESPGLLTTVFDLDPPHP